MFCRTLVLFAALAACTTEPGTVSDDPSNDDTPVVETPEAWDGPTITMSGRMVDSLYKIPIAGLELCVSEPYTDAACATTDADGYYSLQGVPAGTEIMVSFAGPDYFPTYLSWTTEEGADIAYDGGVYGTGTVDYLTTLIDQTLDPNKGHLAFSAVDEKGGFVKGVRVSTLQPVGTGTFFTAGNGKPDPELTATDSPGRGIIVNVDPGIVDVVFEHDERTCTVEFGWEGSVEGSIAMEAIAGGMTYARALCIDENDQN